MALVAAHTHWAVAVAVGQGSRLAVGCRMVVAGAHCMEAAVECSQVTAVDSRVDPPVARRLVAVVADIEGLVDSYSYLTIGANRGKE